MDRVLFINMLFVTMLSLSGCEDPSRPEGDNGPDTPVDENCYAVSVSDCDFSRDKVWQAKDSSGDVVALITLEYLGKALGKQAVLIYTRDSETRWRIDSVFVAAVRLEQSGTGYVCPVECCSGGTVKYYPADGAWFYNDITEAMEDDFDLVFVKKMSDGSTCLKHSAVTDKKAYMEPMRLRHAGYEYPLVKISGFLWTAENIRATVSASGKIIPQAGGWTSRNARLGYSSDEKAGCLYNYYAASELAPQGWHIPSGGSAGEWAVLASFVDGASELKKSAADVTGLSVVPSGRFTSSGEFYEPENDDCIFWSSTSTSDTKAYFAKIYHKTSGDAVQYASSTDMRSGFAVRFIRNF